MLSGATCLVSNGNNISSRVANHESPPNFEETNDLGPYQYVVSRALLLMKSKADKVPLETEPVACDNKTILALKPADQTLSHLTQLIIIVLKCGISKRCLITAVYLQSAE